MDSLHFGCRDDAGVEPCVHIKSRLPQASLQSWHQLNAIAQRWATGQFKDARDNLAFHLDESMGLFQSGCEEMIANGGPVTLATGDGPTGAQSSFAFGQRVLSLGLWPNEPGEQALPPDERKARREERIAAFITALLVDQNKARDLIQKVLFEMLRPASGVQGAPMPP